MNAVFKILCVSFAVAYHVDNNRDIFYKEILEGIYIILIGKCCSFKNPLVVVGGNRKYFNPFVNFCQLRKSFEFQNR